ncbi:hypothetical protein BBJ29_006914 [Phytophthora kernoviae]|uniref:Uncharacterized protein n=1 Tax=Phytophthora kernoviae TaxID=325452 RepID=A0A3F2RYW6_9STRA|nr:hypothetical protein BBP00_00001883 [Phytophthora kernoviae]RLN71716.1 hypothetical protein BBJ29_006914 [Phytophthora kernoviae]
MSEELQEAVDGFFLAAEYGRSDVIKALADHGRGRLILRDVIDPVTGRSPLHVAVASGKKDAIRVLLAAGFPPDVQSNSNSNKQDENCSAYALAQHLKAQELLLVFHQFLVQQVAANDVESVRQLISAGVDVAVTDAATGGSLLHWAASCQAIDVMKDLLEREDVKRKKLVDCRNNDGATPLHLACHENQVECVKILLMHHADVSLKAVKGFSEGKTAVEVTTSQEIRELFTQSSEESAAKVMQTENAVENDEASTSGVVPCGSTASERRNSRTCPHEAHNTKLLLQLEEKDLLVNQLKKTIEVLVQESQEIQMLGEERVMLDYVRKLRDEKMVVQRQLEDSNNLIKDQRHQLECLKGQIRQMATVTKQQSETDHDILSHTSDGTVSSAAGPPDSNNSDSSVPDDHYSEMHLDEEDGHQEPRAQPLKLDAWTSKAQRNDEGGTQDEDGEIIMTV